MLIEDFYTVGEVISDGHNLNTKVKLNLDHEVYRGHFPNQPIVPGVIQLQIVKEILETSLNVDLIMVYIIQAKYLIPIVPQEYPGLEIKINIKNTDEKSIKVDAFIGIENIVFTKVKLEYKPKMLFS